MVGRCVTRMGRAVHRIRCSQRSDDTEDKAKARLEVFYKNQDCLNAYVGKIVRIDGNRTKEVVFADIKRAIDSAFN